MVEEGVHKGIELQLPRLCKAGGCPEIPKGTQDMDESAGWQVCQSDNHQGRGSDPNIEASG